VWLLQMEGSIELDTGPVDSFRDMLIGPQGQVTQGGIELAAIGAKVRSKAEVFQ
jgi:hypothetical protein